MGRYGHGQSIGLIGPTEGDHESYDTKVSTRPEYKSNKKKPCQKIPIRSAVVAMTDTQTHRQTD